MQDDNAKHMRRAIELARLGMSANSGGPFGCVVVKDGRIVGEGSNLVTSANDPTAHAEIVAIRNACRNLGSFQLQGCSVYTSCEPCPMCLGAIYWARAAEVFFACTREDAAEVGFDDELFYSELAKPTEERTLKMINILRPDAKTVFDEWATKTDKTRY
jgi:tRNA(Arg) A34 adenosine deaminase TadA